MFQNNIILYNIFNLKKIKILDFFYVILKFEINVLYEIECNYVKYC